MKELAMLKDLKRRWGHLDRDDVLDLIGLEERRDRVLPGLAMFGAGLLLGVGLGLMLAPKSGGALRSELKAHLGRGDGEPKPEVTHSV